MVSDVESTLELYYLIDYSCIMKKIVKKSFLTLTKISKNVEILLTLSGCASQSAFRKLKYLQTVSLLERKYTIITYNCVLN